MSPRPVSPDELLTTTRAVRRRLDLERPVSRDLVRECVEVALQAPSGGNTQKWHFVAVFDADRRSALAELYREAWSRYRNAPGSVYALHDSEPPGPRRDQFRRVCASADYLVDNLHRVPVHVIACIEGRVDALTGHGATAGLAAIYGSIFPATWSYMLAARCRGLGTTLTTAHLMKEKEAAEVLGIPFERVTQVALVPTAHCIGASFRPALRRPVDDVLHLDTWQGQAPPT